MRFDFDDGGYLEFQRSIKPHHIHVIVAVRKPNNKLELLVNSAEIHLSKLIEGVNSVTGPIMLQDNKGIENDNSGNNSKHSEKSKSNK